MLNFAVSPGAWEEVRPVIYGYEECMPGHFFGPAVRHYYLLHYVYDGEGWLQKAGQTYKVETGDVFVIRPDEITTYGTGKDNPWKYAWLGFVSGMRIPALDEAVLRKSALAQTFLYIRDHCADDEMDGKIYSLTYDLVWRLTKQNRTTKSATDSYAGYARAYLENAYMTDVSIQSIADSLHIDRRYLTRQFTQAYGVSPQSYLMQLRMDQAARFLEKGCSVAATAQMVGFKDLPNFSRHFKRIYGISPSQINSGKK